MHATIIENPNYFNSDPDLRETFGYLGYGSDSTVPSVVSNFNNKKYKTSKASK